MHKRLFNRKFASALIIVVLIMNGCSRENPYNYLSQVLNKLDQLKSANYFQTFYAYNNGDSIPYGSNYKYFNEYINLSDTSVGASFLEYTGDDTSKVIYAYDGVNQARIDWNNKTVRIDDFQNNPYRFRVIMAPFMTYTKAIIKYSLEKKDSIKIISTDYGDSVLYKITFYDQFLDFVGKLPVPVYNIPIIPDGSAKGKSTVYEIWIDKSNDLPYKIKREMPQDMFIRSIKMTKANVNTVKNLTVFDYFPSDFPLMIREKKKSVLMELEGTKAPEWTLTNYNKEIISLNKIKSKILLIEFSGIGCGPCYQAIPFLKQLVIDNKNNDFEFISIEAWNKNIDLLKNYHEKNDLNYKLLLSTPDVLEGYHVELVPSFLIIDQDRVIRKIFEGYSIEITDKEIREIIKDLL